MTKQEKEAMQAVWKTGGGFIKDFLKHLPGPPPPYTTLASTIKKLENKGFLTSEKIGNTYRFKPLIKEKDYSRSFMQNFVKDYFQNSYMEMVAFFAKEKEISTEDLKEVIFMIEEHKSN